MTSGKKPHDRQPSAEQQEEAGDRACWAHLVCPECGAVESEGHRPGCALARAAGATERPSLTASSPAPPGTI